MNVRRGNIICERNPQQHEPRVELYHAAEATRASGHDTTDFASTQAEGLAMIG